MNLNFTLNKNINFDRLVDSMQLDSGTTVATLDVGDYHIYIETQGHVSVWFNPDPNKDARDGDRYRCATDFPEALMAYFSHDPGHPEYLGPDTPKNIQIDENNWFEVIVEKDGAFLWSNVAEGVDECTPDEIFGYLWDIYKDESRRKAEPGTVIHGTLRSQDLVPAFAKKYAELDPKAADRFVTEHGALREALYELSNGNELPYWESLDAIEDGNDLADILDRYAPEGHYFGSHPGDGSDFGFWEETC